MNNRNDCPTPMNDLSDCRHDHSRSSPHRWVRCKKSSRRISSRPNLPRWSCAYPVPTSMTHLVLHLVETTWVWLSPRDDLITLSVTDRWRVRSVRVLITPEGPIDVLAHQHFLPTLEGQKQVWLGISMHIYGPGQGRYGRKFWCWTRDAQTPWTWPPRPGSSCRCYPGDRLWWHGGCWGQDSPPPSSGVRLHPVSRLYALSVAAGSSKTVLPYRLERGNTKGKWWRRGNKTSLCKNCLRVKTCRVQSVFRVKASVSNNVCM